MEVRGPNGERPGSTLDTQGGDVTFTVRVSAPSWISADTLETVLDGAPEGTVVPLVPLPGNTGPGKVYENTITLKRDAAKAVSWVVFHAKGAGDLSPLHPGKRPFAASSPLWLK